MQLSVCELILFTTAPDEPSLWRMADKHAGLVLCCGFRTGTCRRQQGYELQQIHVIAYEGEYTKITQFTNTGIEYKHANEAV